MSKRTRWGSTHVASPSRSTTTRPTTRVDEDRDALTGDRRTDRLLGAQIIGAYGAEISKRIDIVAAALHHAASVERLNDLDLSYTPPLSGPWDPFK
jgi:hypothetical protein